MLCVVCCEGGKVGGGGGQGGVAGQTKCCKHKRKSDEIIQSPV